MKRDANGAVVEPAEPTTAVGEKDVITTWVPSSAAGSQQGVIEPAKASGQVQQAKRGADDMAQGEDAAKKRRTSSVIIPALAADGGIVGKVADTRTSPVAPAEGLIAEAVSANAVVAVVPHVEQKPHASSPRALKSKRVVKREEDAKPQIAPFGEDIKPDISKLLALEADAPPPMPLAEDIKPDISAWTLNPQIPQLA